LQKFRDLTAPLLADLSPQPTASGTTASNNFAAAAAGSLAAASSATAGMTGVGPVVTQPPAGDTSAFSVSSVLEDSRFHLDDNRSRISAN
jgi:hypothetical protein